MRIPRKTALIFFVSALALAFWLSREADSINSSEQFSELSQEQSSEKAGGSPAPSGSPSSDGKHYVFDEELEADSEVIQTGPTPGFIFAIATPSPTPESAGVNTSPTPEGSLADDEENSDPGVQITIHRDPPAQQNNLLGGVTRRTGDSGGGPETIATAEPSPSPDPNQDPYAQRVGGQARGFTLIAFMHPKARLMADAAVEVLLRSNIEEVYLSALVDGSFGEDFQYLNEVLHRLNQGGRRVFLQLYLTNGPTQRKFETTPITAAFCLIDPYIFRDLIQYETKIRNQFKEIAAKARASFNLNLSLGPRNTNAAVMMLEDNLEKYSYQAMRALAFESIGSSAIYVRNPCPGCYPGNDTLTFGDGFEAHEPALITLLRPTDGYSLDGFGYLYPNEAGSQLPYEQVKLMMQNSLDHGLRYFGLWRAGKQGLGPAGQIHPDDREYEIPTEDQKIAEIELLRSGLFPVDSGPAK